MSEHIITISDGQGKELYRRLVETDSIAKVITELDKALNVKPRKKRTPKTFDASVQPTNHNP